MPKFERVRHVLMDVEGTTTSIKFVHETLFPYASKHLAEYVGSHGDDPAVISCLNETRRDAAAESDTSVNEVDAVAVLLAWIKADRKHPALKRLQGMIWEHGYRSGGFTAPLYDDVLPALRAWHAAGKRLSIYSSGSVKAQRLLFGFTEHGDVTPLLSNYFDTGVGNKREAASYSNIAGELKSDPASILFLSDVPAELDAARASGYQTVHVVRPGTASGSDHVEIGSFADLTLA